MLNNCSVSRLSRAKYLVIGVVTVRDELSAHSSASNKFAIWMKVHVDAQF